MNPDNIRKENVFYGGNKDKDKDKNKDKDKA
jgi:hypothetical protein